MQVVIFYGNVERPEPKEELQRTINRFLKEIPKSSVAQLQTVPCQQGHAAVFIWLRADAKDAP